MTITLDQIKAEQTKLSALIAAFEAQPKPYLPEGITLAEGERFICSITRPDGKTTHSILLPGDVSKDWNESMAWAASIGGDLPTRIEQAALFELMKEEFQECAYWSNTQPSGRSNYAWYQNFFDGGQYYTFKDNKLRARAVRRTNSAPPCRFHLS